MSDSEQPTSATQSSSGHDKTIRRQLLEEAADLIDGDRNHTYGSPTQNFSNIAEMWNTRFRHMLKPGSEFTASDVADAQIIVKVARGIAQKKRDNYVDIAGYAACGQECEETQDKKEQTDTPIYRDLVINISGHDVPGASAKLRADLERQLSRLHHRGVY